MSEIKFGLEQYLERYYEDPEIFCLVINPPTKLTKETLGNIDIATAAEQYVLRSGAKQCKAELVHCTEKGYVLCVSWINSYGSLETFYDLCFK